MITIDIQTHENNILRLDIKGHANYKAYGEDVVCAGVSSIAIGLLNACDQLSGDCKCSMEDNEITIVANKQNNERLQLILQTGVIQLKTIQESYSNFIKLNKQEV